MQRKTGSASSLGLEHNEGMPAERRPAGLGDKQSSGKPGLAAFTASCFSKDNRTICLPLCAVQFTLTTCKETNP